MVSIKALDTLRPADLWREGALEEEFWGEVRQRQRRMLKVLLEGALEEEQVGSLAAGRYRRMETRRGYRNGFYGGRPGDPDGHRHGDTGAAGAAWWGRIAGV